MITDDDPTLVVLGPIGHFHLVLRCRPTGCALPRGITDEGPLLGHTAVLRWIDWFLHAWQEDGLISDPLKGFVRRFMTALMGKMLLSLVALDGALAFCSHRHPRSVGLELCSALFGFLGLQHLAPFQLGQTSSRQVNMDTYTRRT